MSEEEKPRVRVAAERCAAPDLRERMVRVAFAPSDDEVAEALDASLMNRDASPVFRSS